MAKITAGQDVNGLLGGFVNDILEHWTNCLMKSLGNLRPWLKADVRNPVIC